MKKICVFGASGRTGREFVKLAIENEKYSVLSVVRSEKSANKIPEGSEILIGDTNSQDFIDECVSEADIVVSLIGHGKNSPANFQTEMIRKIISAMEKIGNQRLITLTGTGVRQPDDKIPLYDRVGNYIINKIDPDRIQDGINHVKKIENSNINWTVIRVFKLSNLNFLFDIEKHYKLKANGPAKFLVSRKTIAYKILKIIESEEWNKKYPVL
jgi:putative NADH-flavin reductase